MNPLQLLQLLGAAGATPPPPAEAEDEILVTGKKRTGPQGLGSLPRYDPADLPPLDDKQPVMMRNNEFLTGAKDAQQSAPERKGMFGVKGTLRDVLGLIGDTYLTTNGRNPIYRPVQQQEREADAMAGFSENPQAAMERLAALPGGQEMAQKLMAQYQADQVRQTQAAAVAQNRQSMDDDRSGRRSLNFMKYAGQTLAGIDPKNSAALAQTVELLRKRAEALKIDPSDLGITPDMSPEEIQATVAGSIGTYQTRQLPIAQQNADANTTRANRPPAGRAPPQQGLSNVDAGVANAVLNGTATPAQQKYYNDRIKRPSKGGALSSILGEDAPVPAFRIVRQRPKQ